MKNLIVVLALLIGLSSCESKSKKSNQALDFNTNVYMSHPVRAGARLSVVDSIDITNDYGVLIGKQIVNIFSWNDNIISIENGVHFFDTVWIVPVREIMIDPISRDSLNNKSEDVFFKEGKLILF